MNEFGLALRINAYLTATVAAFRTLDQRQTDRANSVWAIMTTQERTLAYDVLAVTGTEVW